MGERSIVVVADSEEKPNYRRLRLRGEELTLVSCGEAFEMIGKLRPEIVLIDCGTRVKRGLKLLRHVKTAVPQTIVLLLTDVSSELSAVTAFRWGARDYIKKPVSLKLLGEIIRDLLALKRKSSERRSPFGIDAGEASVLVAEYRKKDIPDRLLDTLLHIEDHLGEKLALASLARHARLDRFYFTRYFTKHVGVSPMKYVYEKRIKLARHLLRRTDLNITEISHLVGSSDLSGFITRFKRSTGLTPSAFRKTLKPRP